MTIVELLKIMGDKELVITQSGESIDFLMKCNDVEMLLGIVAIETFHDQEEIVDDILKDMIDELDEYLRTGIKTYFLGASSEKSLISKGPE